MYGQNSASRAGYCGALLHKKRGAITPPARAKTSTYTAKNHKFDRPGANKCSINIIIYNVIITTTYIK